MITDLIQLFGKRVISIIVNPEPHPPLHSRKQMSNRMVFTTVDQNESLDPPVISGNPLHITRMVVIRVIPYLSQESGPHSSDHFSVDRHYWDEYLITTDRPVIY